MYATSAMTDYAAARFHMVECQVRPNKVTDQAVIEAMMAIPREQFVPEAARAVAYVDEDIRIAPGRYLMEPMVLARLIQEAGIAAEDVVLDVASGTGYAAAVLGRISASVIGVEGDGALAEQAQAVLRAVDARGVTVVAGDPTAGYPGQAPYNVIVVSGGAVAEVPTALFHQLAEGGRLVAVVAGRRVGVATLYLKRGGTVSRRPLFDANTPVLPGFEAKPGFVF